MRCNEVTREEKKDYRTRGEEEKSSVLLWKQYCVVFTCLCDSRFVILLSRTSEHDFTKQRERERSDVHLNAFNSFYIHTDITQSIIHEWPYVYSTQHLHIVVGLIASIVLICKSLQKKTSAKWSNINVNAY